MKNRILDITCLGYESGNPSTGYDYSCEYGMSGEISCDECVCTGGDYSPITGKLIDPISRLIQRNRNMKKYKYIMLNCDKRRL